MDVTNPRILAALGAILLFGASGCTTSTGEKVKLDQARMSAVRQLDVAASASKPFQVKFSRDEAGDTGAMIGAATFGLAGALVGGSIESGAKSAADRKKTQGLAQALAAFEGPAYLENEVAKRMTAAGLFSSVKVVPTNHVAKASEAVLHLNLREWGLRRVQAGGTNEMLQIGFDVNVRLAGANDTAIWARDDFFLDGQAASLAEYRDTPGLLVERLSNALGVYAGRLVNELRYSNSK